MPWVEKPPPKENRHTLRARIYDAKAARAVRRGDPISATHYSDKADKAARKGGWL
jgi:hypothetical protein